VGELTENPPQSQLTSNFPYIGNVEIRLVITVAAQNDICPHGKTYPRNAVIIIIIKIMDPEFHVLVNLKEYINMFLKICQYKRMNMNEAMFMCIKRINHPIHTSRDILIVLVNDSSM